MAIAPCLALVVGQAARRRRRAAAILALALVVSAIGLRGFDRYQISHAIVRDPDVPRASHRSWPSSTASASTRVFTNYWIAYRLDFDTNERIVAVENGFDKVEVRDGGVLPTHYPKATWPAYENVGASRPARVRVLRPLPSDTAGPGDALEPRLHAPLGRRVRGLRAARSGQPTVIRSFGKLVRSSTPSSRTTARSSIRTPPRPGR